MLRLTSGGWTFATIYAVTATALVPAAFGVGPSTSTTPAQWLLYIPLCWSSMRLGLILGKGVDRIVSLFFWVYVYVFLGLAPLVQLGKRKFSFPETYDSSLILSTCVVVIVGIVGYEVGQWRATTRLADRPAGTTLFTRVVRPRAIYLLGLGSVAITPLLVSRLGGLGTLLSSREAVGEALGAKNTFEYGNNAVGALVIAFLNVPIHLAAVCALLLRYAMEPRAWRRQFPRWWLALIIGVDLIVNNPIAQSRFWFGTVVVSFACVFIRTDRRRTFRLFAIAVVLAIVFVFPYADRYRYNSANPTRNFGLTEVLTNKSDHDSFQQIVNSVQYVSTEGVTDGGQLVGVATFWVPRSLWQNKPLDTGPLIAKYKGYTLENVSAPLWAEGYINFSYFGTALLLFGFGYLSARLEFAWLNRGRRVLPLQVASAVVPIFAAYQLILLRGSLLQATGRVVLLLLLIRLCSSPAHDSRSQATGQQIRTRRDFGEDPTIIEESTANAPPEAERLRDVARTGYPTPSPTYEEM